jgi:hypothetical protein
VPSMVGRSGGQEATSGLTCPAWQLAPAVLGAGIRCQAAGDRRRAGSTSKQALRRRTVHGAQPDGIVTFLSVRGDVVGGEDVTALAVDVRRRFTPASLWPMPVVALVGGLGGALGNRFQSSRKVPPAGPG